MQKNVRTMMLRLQYPDVVIPNELQDDLERFLECFPQFKRVLNNWSFSIFKSRISLSYPKFKIDIRRETHYTVFTVYNSKGNRYEFRRRNAAILFIKETGLY